ncbi:folylpolyglutamate synthase [Exophiala aquamarina CBS 119918]|uniref:Folylpolyglutamate synthase n=1 Tax=Exophiala aquamarina CBS 119918 TaxID=1182545 RepID=A0A072PT28_9EURO|nr:folylpolyglutamate synthase [Exophiala aquamarina CBS 119918]KEF63239.1 folylpolyglutamate synthase [Exophiala aquamarina CBS 119918]
MARTYADAVASLNTLQSNFAIVDAIRKSGRKMNDQAIPEMVEWCNKIGYKPSDFDALKAIHIAGTKGKGSTAAFVSSILAQFVKNNGNKSLSKVGLYTSPHLRFVRERIQINGEPLSEEQFAKYFFEVWDRLEQAAKADGQDPAAPGTKPVYFRYLTLMAFHTYISENVDAAVIECGIGGAYDSTNVIEKPLVTGITSLGIDHVAMLGSTIGEIAWHKAGIMKTGAKCLTVSSQPEDAKAVLEQVAKEKGTTVEFVDVDPEIANNQIKLGLQAEFQKTNASLAQAVAKQWLTQQGYSTDADAGFEAKVRRGLETVRWAGRCETRHETGIQWCIDGGHTLESIELAGKWFASQLTTTKSSSTQHVSPSQPRFLIFNQQTRDANALATALFNTLSTALGNSQPFTHAIFCTNTTFKETGFRPDLVSVNTNASDVEALKVQSNLAETWQGIDPQAQVQIVRTIEEAVASVRQFAQSHANEERHGHEDVTALVTGSLHLVGGFLEVLESDPSSSATA